MLFFYLNLSITWEDFNTVTNHCHCNLHGLATLMMCYLKGSSSFIGKCGKIKYLGMGLTGQSYIYEETKRRLTLENACCRSICIDLFHSGVKMTI
jgi:hypothetical protein